MNAATKKKLIESITKAEDLASLKASLLKLLGVEVVEGEECSDVEPEAPPGPPNTLKRPRLSDGKPPGPKNAKNVAPGNRPKPSELTAVNFVRKPAATAPKANNIPAGKPAAEAPTSQPAATQPTATESGSRPEANNGAVSAIDVTDARDMDTEAIDGPDNGAFKKVTNPRDKRRQAAAANKEHANATNGPVKPKPLVLDGLSENEKVNSVEVRNRLGKNCDLIQKSVTTHRGTVLLFTRSEDDRTKLLQATLGRGLTLRETKVSNPGKENNYAVIVGISPTISDAEISAEVGMTCKRIQSARLGGAAIWKVKIQCASANDKAELMKIGVGYGLQRYKVVDFKSQRPVLQCYKCQGFGHVAIACSSDERCRNCGENHNSKDCVALTPACANCKGNHAASDFACPQIEQQVIKREASTLNYANAVKKSGDQVDCLRLACSMAAAITTILEKRAGLKVNPSDIFKDVADNVALFYRVNIRGDHVHEIAKKAINK
jgi:hypothetical protein